MTEIPDRLAAALADRYRVERELGQGGMATVYRAHDLRHDRDVAIKVLHPDLGAALGGERFLSEIRTTARLQHPHILPLLDSGEADGLLYYVMPLVTGETLRSRLDRDRQLPIDEALRIAREVADALDHAHGLGVIHRDIKPENILLQGGHAVVADFGIALAVQQAGGQRMTQTGLSLGTPQYMSPEQAMGERAIDARSDLYALGAVTYEMLVGEAPFTGPTVQAIVARLITEEPRGISAQRKAVPEPVEAAVLRALEKLPADRFATAKEFVAALDGGGAPAGRKTHGGRTQRRGGQARPAGSLRLWQAATALLAVATLVTGWLVFRERAAARAAADAAPVIRAHFDLPAGARVSDALVGNTIAVSPAGDLIAFTSIAVNGFRMYLRRVNELAAREIGDANFAGRNLTFSPDGKWLAFTEGNVLRKIGVDGGAVVTLGSTGGAVPYGLVWSATDTIYIGSFSGLHLVPASGGTPVPFQATDGSVPRLGQRWPLLLPGGRALAYPRGNSSSAPSQLSVVDLQTGVVTDHALQVSMPLGILDDQLVYISSAGELMTVQVEVRTGRPLAPPVLLEEGVLYDPTAGAKAALSPSGTLVLLRGRAQIQPVLVSPTGAVTPLLDELRTYATPRFSPDGRRVALTVFGGASTDIWIQDRDRNTFSRLTTEGGNLRPEWTADGKDIVFISDRGDRPAIWRQAADGSRPAELLYQPAQEPFEAIVSPDMRTLVYRTAPGLEHPRDILAVPFPGTTTDTAVVTPLVAGPTTESMPRFSPNGRWIAYQSNISGRFEVYVRPFPGNAGPVQVSPGGGSEALWGRDGRALYYKGPLGEIIEVAVSTGDAFTIGAHRTVHTGDYLLDSTHPNWDVSPDGRFLLLKRAGEEAQMVVAHGWVRELRARVAGRR